MNNSSKILKIDFNQDIRRVPLEECTFTSLIKQVCQLYKLQEGSFVLKYKDEEGDLVTIGSELEFEETKGCFQQKMLRLSVFEKKKEEGRKERCEKWKRWACKFKEGENDQPQGNQERHFGHHGRHHGHGKFFGHGSHGQHFGNHGEHFSHHGHHGHHERRQHTKSFGHGPHVPHGHHERRHPHGHCGRRFGLMRGLKEMASKLIEEGKCENFESFLNSDFCTVEHNNICDGCESKIRGTRYHCKTCKDFDFCSKCFEEKIKTHDSNHQFEKISALHALKQAFRNGEQIDSFFTQKIPSNSVESVVEKNTETSTTNNPISSPIEEPKVELKVEEHKIEQPKEGKSFSMKLVELETMGFKDRKRNIQLLLKNKGDLHFTLQELTN